MRPPKPAVKSHENRRSMPRAALPHETFVLIELPSGEERLEPLLDLSPTGVAVLLRAQRSTIQPGTVLKRLRFFTNGECTLQTRASIRDVQPTTLEDGTLGAKLGLKLESGVDEDKSEPATQEYVEPPIIVDAVQNLVAAKAVVHLDASPAPATLAFTRADPKTRSLVLTLKAGSAPTLRRGHEVQLVSELYGTRLAVVAKYRERRGEELRLGWPSCVRIWKHRAGGRLNELPPDLDVTFESPFLAGEITRPVVDLAPKGIAFVSQTEDGLLVGMLLRSLSLKLPNGTIQGQAVVRNVRRCEGGGFVTGIELTDVSDNSLRLLSEFVDAHFHPEVRAARPEDLRLLWPLYDSMGLFPRPHAALSPVAPAIEATRLALLTRGRDLHLQMVAGGDEQLVATAELLRTYGSTWSLQHVFARADADLTADAVVVPLVQAALRRTDFTHLHAILDPARSKDRLAKLLAIESAPDTLVVRRLILVGAAADALPVMEQAHEVQEAAAADLEWVATRVGEQLTALELMAMRLHTGELRLEETGRFFHSLGVWRGRRVRLAMSVGGPLGFSLIERASAGLSFDGHADLARIYTLRNTGATRQTTLLSLAFDALRLERGGERRHVLFLVAADEAKLLVAAGLTPLGERLEVVASRDGAQRVVNCLNLLS
jgi:hypothetical protein